jgi:SAM-dependent methyltransferase
MTFSATYDPADDKLRLTASSRLDAELYQRVKKVGFRWAPKQELFFAVWNPAAEDICIELAGEIEDEDSSLVERAEARADRFEGYSEKRTREAESAHSAIDYIAQRFEGGQPILVGHHSEKRARKDAERIENGMRKALKLWDTAGYWTDRAAGALRHAKYLERPTVRARRIKGLESDVRVYRSKFTPIGEPIMQHRWNEYGDDKPKIPHVFCAPRGGRGGHYVPVEDLPGIERHYSRWIAHAENRLAYEKAMLAEAGASDLLKRKPKSAAASLPLCNYRAPEGLDVENIWRRGEILRYPQMEMTAAEYAAIYADYKGTRVIGSSHRVRTAVVKQCHVCVFITDSKTHVPPGAIEAKPAEPVLRELNYTPTPAPEAGTVAAKIEQLRAAVNAGVKVVTADQLFPTPVTLAERMVSLADIRPGHHVLEPSAGTGRILAALPNVRPGGYVVAVEINYNLAKLLEEIADDTRNCDFLECNGNLGKFDRVLMNPPFSNGDDIRHIRHAVTFLKPGGRLVAICAGGPKQHEQLKPIAATWEPLPAGTFEESGTGVNTVLLTIDAPAATIERQAITGQTMSLFPEGEL